MVDRQREARATISAPPERVYALVSDVTRMGEWSPECRRAEWIEGATAPTVGARFKGYNKRRGSWSTKCTVITAEPGREFAFSVGKDETRWHYRFEPAAAGNGTAVTESFEIVKEPGVLGRWFTKLGAGVSWAERPDQMEQGMRETLERLKAVAEAG